MNRLVATGIVLALATAFGSQAFAFSTESYTAGGHSKYVDGLTDPDETSPVQATPNGSGTTYKFGGSSFSLHMSGPQGSDSSSQQMLFSPAGQNALGIQSKGRPRSIFQPQQ